MSNTKHYPTHPGAELTPIELENNLGQDVNGEVHRVQWKAYDIDEVDALISEKNKEITEFRDESAELHNRIATLLSQIRIRDERIDELKAKLESVHATAYAESVDAGMRERKLKRALWLDRAEKAKTAKNMFDILWKFASREKVGVTGCAHKIKGAKTLKEPKFFFAKFQIAENKCRAKAEEHK